jgi:hypothetical protein
MKPTNPSPLFSIRKDANALRRSGIPVAWQSLCVAVMSAFALFAAFAPNAQAQNESALLINGDFSAELKGWSISPNGVSQQVLEVSDAPTVSGSFPKHCLSLTLTPPPEAKPFSQQILQRLRQEVKEGKAVTLKFWARSPESLKIEAIWGESGAPYAASAMSSIKLTPSWAQYEVSGIASRTFLANEAMIRFHLGNVPGRIDLTGVEVSQN